MIEVDAGTCRWPPSHSQEGRSRWPPSHSPAVIFLNPQGYIENFLCPGHFLGPKQRQWLMMGTLETKYRQSEVVNNEETYCLHMIHPEATDRSSFTKKLLHNSRVNGRTNQSLL